MRMVVLLSVLLSVSCAPTQSFDSAGQAITGLKTKDGETRTVAFELREGERLIGRPKITARLGTLTSMAVSGDGGYKLNVTVEQHGPGALYLVHSDFYRPVGDGWALVASPSVTVAEGQQTSMVINRMPAPLTLLVSVR